MCLAAVSEGDSGKRTLRKGYELGVRFFV